MWSKEEIYTEGDAYYDALVHSFNNATKSIDMEMYIYQEGEVANKISNSLIEASLRGVKVRLIIDGIGSAGWMNQYGEKFTKAGIQYLFYHKLPWEGWKSWTSTARKAESFLQSILLINHRSHRKIVVIDQQCAFVGSRNICDAHSESAKGAEAWKDISVKICGEPVQDIINAFDRIWYRKKVRNKRPSYKDFKFPDYVRLNIFRKIRFSNYRKLCLAITNAKKRVWITTSYSLPHGRFIKCMKLASRRGIDVKLIIPANSDIPFFPYVTSVFYNSLLKDDIEIYEYKKSILHSKAIIIDDQVIVGSSNVNHRSLLHDLEVDVVIDKVSSIEKFVNCFQEYMKDSQVVNMNESVNSTFIRRCIGHIVLLFRYYL